MSKLGPRSRESTILRLDGRTREAKYMATVRADLTKHVGGSPSATQKILIERAARLSLRLALADEEMLSVDKMPERQGREYVALQNSLDRTVRSLGLKGPPEQPAMTPAEYFSRPQTAA